MPKVLFLIQGFDRPASRYRVLQFTEYLSHHGVACHVEVYPSDKRAWDSIDPLLAHSDIVFVQKKRLERWQINRIRAHRCKLVFDVDDAVMYQSSRHRWHYSFTRRRAFARMCRAADLVIAGNPILRRHAERYNDRIEVIPTSVDTTQYPLHTDLPNNATVTVGWIGGRKSLPFLAALAPALREVAGDHPEMTLKIVSSQFLKIPGVSISESIWSAETEASEVASFDIGLAPLPNDRWSEGKCATKLLQCMACGVPTVAAAVGVHKEIIDHGVNGFLAQTPQEWVDGLRALIEDPSLRKTMAPRCRTTVEERYSVASQQPRLLRMLLALKS